MAGANRSAPATPRETDAEAGTLQSNGAGSKAREEIWPDIAGWLAERSDPSHRSTPRQQEVS